MPVGAFPRSWRSEIVKLVAACAAIAAVTGFRYWFHLTNPTIAALSYLLVVLLAAAGSTLKVAIVTSVLADLCLNYFFMPPVGTFSIADPQNWVALFTFLAVSVVASNLSTAARDRTREAMARRDAPSNPFSAKAVLAAVRICWVVSLTLASRASTAVCTCAAAPSPPAVLSAEARRALT